MQRFIMSRQVQDLGQSALGGKWCKVAEQLNQYTSFDAEQLIWGMNPWPLAQ